MSGEEETSDPLLRTNEGESSTSSSFKLFNDPLRVLKRKPKTPPVLTSIKISKPSPVPVQEEIEYDETLTPDEHFYRQKQVHHLES